MDADQASQLKQDLRQWEVDFRKVHGRPPSKQDIDQEPSVGKPELKKERSLTPCVVCAIVAGGLFCLALL